MRTIVGGDNQRPDRDGDKRNDEPSVRPGKNNTAPERKVPKPRKPGE